MIFYFKHIATVLCCILIIDRTFSQNNKKITLATSAYEGIRVTSGLDVMLIASNVNKLIVEGENSDFVVISLKNKILKIALSNKRGMFTKKTKIELYHSRDLKTISVNKSSRVASSQTISQTNLFLEAKTNSQIDLEVYVKKIKTNLSFGGRVYLEGKANEHVLNFSTSSICEAEQLISKTTKINCKMGAYAYINSKNRVDVKMYGGVLRVFGAPKTIKTSSKYGAKVYLEE